MPRKRRIGNMVGADAYSPDGERFVMLAAASSESREIHVVLNWLEELKRIVPTN